MFQHVYPFLHLNETGTFLKSLSNNQENNKERFYILVGRGYYNGTIMPAKSAFWVDLLIKLHLGCLNISLSDRIAGTLFITTHWKWIWSLENLTMSFTKKQKNKKKRKGKMKGRRFLPVFPGIIRRLHNCRHVVSFLWWMLRVRQREDCRRSEKKGPEWITQRIQLTTFYSQCLKRYPLT